MDTHTMDTHTHKQAGKLARLIRRTHAVAAWARAERKRELAQFEEAQAYAEACTDAQRAARAEVGRGARMHGRGCAVGGY